MGRDFLALVQKPPFGVPEGTGRQDFLELTYDLELGRVQLTIRADKRPPDQAQEDREHDEIVLYRPFEGDAQEFETPSEDGQDRGVEGQEEGIGLVPAAADLVGTVHVNPVLFQQVLVVEFAVVFVFGAGFGWI